MARELHDVVSSQVASIALTSGAVLNTEPDAERDRAALKTIRVTSVEALEELRQMVQVLRSADADEQAAVQQVRALEPDVVLMDARMPGTDGIEATAQIVAQTQTQVLMLTTFDLDEVIFGALQAGAAGFLLKSAEPPVC
ncbi:response regulator [Nesterenkonia sp. MY13]|uniref:Response regulator n=2 Tax=Nesterenkonia sedimenti TaxID=1463632 RepID=A0A7X8TJI9_9MICC|nr:response regulator [Nesterenkonia sedimenti]